MLFEETLTFDGGSDEVWRRASNIKEIPSYWHGTRSLDVVGEEKDRVHAKVRFAFGGSGEAEIFRDEEKRVLTIDYKSGPFTGKQTVTVGDGKITARRDVRFRGAFRLASRWNEGHLKSGTRHALERLAGSSPSG
jgi:hypothetical protein